MMKGFAILVASRHKSERFMDVDQILDTMNRHQVAYLLLGGMNFLMRHSPVVTYDVDLWIADTEDNRARCEAALSELNAEWGSTDENWEPVAAKAPGWLVQQPLFCVNSPAGAIDIFRCVAGLSDWQACFDRAPLERTGGGIAYRGLSDYDMLQCQYALEKSQQKRDRVAVLEAALKKQTP